MVAMQMRTGERLGAYSLFAAVLSGAGLPIYIYAPKFFADTYGVSLAALASVLFALRLFDVVQDPVLGWITERLGAARKLAIALGAALLALSMLGLFAVVPPIDPLWWFALTITGLFTAFSFLSINFYAQGIAKADVMGGAHTRLAAWRETGALLGICVAAIVPTVLMGQISAPFAGFALGFAVLVLVATALMSNEWTSRFEAEPTGITDILKDPMARRLLILALVNATPLAVSSTLFLFFVESGLNAPGWEGPLLVLFFLSAAMSSALWAMLATRFGAKPTLMLAMMLAVASFAFVFMLGPGDEWIFAIICIVSGATIGADLTLLPALFAKRMAAMSTNGGQGFGLWSLVSKFTLAFAAIILLPVLDYVGFQSGAADNSARALATLTALYALIPCALKLVALALLAATKLEE